jgi:hypothetical protein
MLEVDQTMLMDMRYVNERRHFCCHVVHQVLMLYVSDMSSPSHVAPGVPATFDINWRSRRNDSLDPMVRAGSCTQVQVVVVWVMARWPAERKTTNPLPGRLSKRRYLIAWAFSPQC